MFNSLLGQDWCLHLFEFNIRVRFVTDFFLEFVKFFFFDVDEVLALRDVIFDLIDMLLCVLQDLG